MSDLSPAQNASRPPQFPTERWGQQSLYLEEAETGSFFGHDGPATFGDFLDIINPLQHLPVISSIYRAITGDEIGGGARAIGGMLYGGPIGMIASGVTALFEEASGGDVVTHVAGLVRDIVGDDTDTAANAAENPDDVRSAAQKASAVEPAAGPGPQASAAALPAGQAPTQVGAQAAAMPAAAANRIAFNPGAPLGVPLTPPTGSAVSAVQTANPQAKAAPARPVALQFASAAAAPAFPAHPGRQPSRNSVAGHSAAQQQRSNPAVSQARQSQADRMLAQWAAQQVALQSARTPSPVAEPSNRDGDGNGNADGSKTPAVVAPTAAAHPMIAPQNASPDWYARAMGAALNKYEAAQGLRPGPALAGQSALPR